MSFPDPAKHPPTCLVCHGTGWQPGHGIPGHHHAKAFTYPTVEPCRHVWWDDNPNVDDYGLDRTQPISFDEYYTRLLARRARGAPGADEELAGWDHAHQIVRDL